jgi:hypothetical protein
VGKAVIDFLYPFFQKEEGTLIDLVLVSDGLVAFHAGVD